MRTSKAYHQTRYSSQCVSRPSFFFVSRRMGAIMVRRDRFHPPVNSAFSRELWLNESILLACTVYEWKNWCTKKQTCPFHLTWFTDFSQTSIVLPTCLRIGAYWWCWCNIHFQRVLLETIAMASLAEPHHAEYPVLFLLIYFKPNILERGR